MSTKPAEAKQDGRSDEWCGGSTTVDGGLVICERDGGHAGRHQAHVFGSGAKIAWGGPAKPAADANAPRTNLDGHPCPPWCASEHIDVNGHYSDYLAHSLTGPRVKVEKHSGNPAGVRVDGNGQVALSAKQAEELASVLESVTDIGDLDMLVDALRVAAGIVRGA